MNYKALLLTLTFGVFANFGCDQKETCVADCEVNSGTASGSLMCEDPQGDIDAYLAANKSCETDDDCTTMDSSCYVDDCAAIAVNLDADPEEWAVLDETLRDCSPPREDNVPEDCNYVGECGFEVFCSAEGQCTADR